MVYRHPGVLANMASTLDITSGGRLELGIGAGWNEEECDAFGIELGTMTERFDRFEEGLAVLESLLTNDRTTFDGRYYKLTDAMNNPKPLQSPVPVCIGGTGKKRTLPMAARYAHHWNFGGTDPARFAECRTVLRDACAAIGRDPSEITCSAIRALRGRRRRDAEIDRRHGGGRERPVDRLDAEERAALGDRRRGRADQPAVTIASCHWRVSATALNVNECRASMPSALASSAKATTMSVGS